eukprot:TRINITY_DN13741_c0_g1_i8.p1 TRINITY_DN13741_c0_g1~~TRINITY_DN13741_c0_g1_i8.p1  ORF type:complete len:104 (+),score=16.91 TRINITY_DN13741_c0_g1_i8:73-384(+)
MCIRDRYNNPANLDKIEEANEKVKEVVVQIQDDIKKVAGSQKEMDDLNARAQQMAANARGFDTEARELERQMFWRNMRLIIIIVAVIIVVLVVVLVPVLVKYA